MKVLFICGHKSRYGAAHIKPLLQSRIKPQKIIIATDTRWEIFRNKLQGEQYYKEKEYFSFNIKTTIKKIFPARWIRHLTDLRSAKNRLDIKSIASSSNIPIQEVYDINSQEVCDHLKKERYDLFLSAAYPQIFSAQLISVPEKGSVNFHPSVLPRCRGAHPHYWALAQGESYGGITAHFMTKNIDDGDIIAQIKFPINCYNYKQHYDKIVAETPNLISKVEKYFLQSDQEPIKQDFSRKTYFQNDRLIHHRIFWNIHDANKIYNLYRAGGSFFFLKGVRVFVKRAYIESNNRNMTNNIQVEYGTIIDFFQDSVVVKVIDGFLHISIVAYKNKELNFYQWANKCKLAIGLKLE